MRIALTGATGFIGRYIAEHLAGQGHQAALLAPSDQRLSVVWSTWPTHSNGSPANWVTAPVARSL